MGTYVLVHGAWHGAWCWYKVAARLQEAGHEVVALDLPGHGIDRTPIEHVTLQAYVRRVCETLEAQEDRVTLVGHSMAGSIISQVAEELPHKIRALVYLASFLLESGESLMQSVALDAEAQMEQMGEIDEARGVFTLARKGIQGLFYHDCPSVDVTLAHALLTPQAIAPLFTPVRLTDRYESVRRISIETCQDHMLGVDFQRLLRSRKPCDRVYSLNSSHSPFFSMPDALVEYLLAA